MAYISTGRKFAAIKSRSSIEQGLKRRDISGAELAKMAGTTRATISNIRRGHTRRVYTETARRIEIILGADPGDLFDYDEVAS